MMTVHSTRPEQSSEDGYENSSSDQSSAGSENSGLLARIKEKDDDHNYDEQYEGDDKDESESQVDVENEVVNECKDEESPKQGYPGSETSDSVASIEHFRRRRNKLVLRPRHRRQDN